MCVLVEMVPSQQSIFTVEILLVEKKGCSSCSAFDGYVKQNFQAIIHNIHNYT